VVDIGDGAHMAVVVIVVGGRCGCGAVQVVIRSPLTLKFCESSTLAAEKTFHQATNKQLGLRTVTVNLRVYGRVLRVITRTVKAFSTSDDGRHIYGSMPSSLICERLTTAVLRPSSGCC